MSFVQGAAPQGVESIKDGQIEKYDASQGRYVPTDLPGDGGDHPVSVEGTAMGTPSLQAVSGDLTLDSASGKAADTSFFAGVMGNIFGDLLTRAANYLAGVIGMYSITGAGASTYPKGAVLAGIGDGSTDADGAVVAWIDGDSGGATKAGAAFKVRHRNSTAGNKFNYGMDLSSAASDGYSAVSFAKAEIKLSSGQCIFTGSQTTRAGVRGEVDATAAIGSSYFSTAGKVYVKVANAAADTDWQKVTSTAAD